MQRVVFQQKIQTSLPCVLAYMQDPKTGVLEVELPSTNPDAWLDHVLVIDEFQLLQGNYGSRTLLRRVA